MFHHITTSDFSQKQSANSTVNHQPSTSPIPAKTICEYEYELEEQQVLHLQQQQSRQHNEEREALNHQQQQEQLLSKLAKT